MFFLFHKDWVDIFEGWGVSFFFLEQDLAKTCRYLLHMAEDGCLCMYKKVG